MKDNVIRFPGAPPPDDSHYPNRTVVVARTTSMRVGAWVLRSVRYALWVALLAVGVLVRIAVRVTVFVGLLTAGLIWIGMSGHPRQLEWIAWALGAVVAAFVASALFGALLYAVEPR